MDAALFAKMLFDKEHPRPERVERQISPGRSEGICGTAGKRLLQTGLLQNRPVKKTDWTARKGLPSLSFCVKVNL